MDGGLDGGAVVLVLETDGSGQKVAPAQTLLPVLIDVQPVLAELAPPHHGHFAHQSAMPANEGTAFDIVLIQQKV